MKLTERVLMDRKTQEREKKRKFNFWEDEADAMGYAYEKAPGIRFINAEKSVFDNKDDTSINTAPSVFDRTAIFRTNTNNGISNDNNNNFNNNNGNFRQ